MSFFLLSRFLTTTAFCFSCCLFAADRQPSPLNNGFWHIPGAEGKQHTLNPHYPVANIPLTTWKQWAEDEKSVGQAVGGMKSFFYSIQNPTGQKEYRIGLPASRPFKTPEGKLVHDTALPEGYTLTGVYVTQFTSDDDIRNPKIERFDLYQPTRTVHTKDAQIPTFFVQHRIESEQVNSPAVNVPILFGIDVPEIVLPSSFSVTRHIEKSPKPNTSVVFQPTLSPAELKKREEQRQRDKAATALAAAKAAAEEEAKNTRTLSPKEREAQRQRDKERKSKADQKKANGQKSRIFVSDAERTTNPPKKIWNFIPDYTEPSVQDWEINSDNASSYSNDPSEIAVDRATPFPQRSVQVIKIDKVTNGIQTIKALTAELIDPANNCFDGNGDITPAGRNVVCSFDTGILGIKALGQSDLKTFFGNINKMSSAEKNVARTVLTQLYKSLNSDRAKKEWLPHIQKLGPVTLQLPPDALRQFVDEGLLLATTKAVLQDLKLGNAPLKPASQPKTKKQKPSK